MIYDCRRQPYFFSDELLSETGYWLGVCHGWFHLHRLPPAARSGSEIYKMKNSSCPQRDSNSRPSDWEAIALTARPRRPVLQPCLNLTRFSLCYLNLYDNTWHSVFSCIQYCTHITSVLFCGLNDNYIRILVHELYIIQSLYALPLLIDCSRIELPRLSLDGNQFGRAEMRSFLHIFLQSFNYYNFISNIFFILSQINS